MQIPISSTVLEDLYHKSIAPLLQGFSEMLLDFQPFFESIIIAPVGLFLVEELDPHLSYVLYGFKGSQQQRMQLDLSLHYHQYFYRIEIFLQDKDLLFEKTWNYGTYLDDRDYFYCINAVGQKIIKSILQFKKF